MNDVAVRSGSFWVTFFADGNYLGVIDITLSDTGNNFHHFSIIFFIMCLLCSYHCASIFFCLNLFALRFKLEVEKHSHCMSV